MITTALEGTHVTAAHFSTPERGGASCTAEPVQVWLTLDANTTTNWNNQPGWATLEDTQNVAHGWSSSCPAAAVGFNVLQGATWAAQHNLDHITLGARAS